MEYSDNTIPRRNCIWKETAHVFQRATFYFLKSIILTIQRSAMSREFVFQIRRCVLLLTILCICRMRLRQRRSDKDSHPTNSS